MLNIILTGMPRSGLTVASAMLDTLPNSVSINHPIWQLRAAARMSHAQEYVQAIIADYAQRRSELLAGLAVADLRAADGAPLLDSLRDMNQPYDGEGNKAFVAYTRHDLASDCTLTMKHHGLYSALLPELLATQHFAIVVVIRHPVDVIHSWLNQSAARAFAQGRIAEPLYRFWPEAADVSRTEDVSVIERMAMLYDAFCARYLAYRDRVNIIKYEELVANPAIVGTLVGTQSMPTAAHLIESRQRMMHMDRAAEIKTAVARLAPTARFFYPN